MWEHPGDNTPTPIEHRLRQTNAEHVLNRCGGASKPLPIGPRRRRSFGKNLTRKHTWIQVSKISRWSAKTAVKSLFGLPESKSFLLKRDSRIHQLVALTVVGLTKCSVRLVAVVADKSITTPLRVATVEKKVKYLSNHAILTHQCTAPTASATVAVSQMAIKRQLKKPNDHA